MTFRTSLGQKTVLLSVYLGYAAGAEAFHHTGADRAGLDWELAHGVECGGWCPKGRKAEEGPIDPKYPLKETPLASYLQRIEWIVGDTNATVLFFD